MSMVDDSRGRVLSLGACFAEIEDPRIERTRLHSSAYEELGFKQIAIDGKSLRRSHDQASLKKMLHSVCAWSVENHLVLGEQAVDEKLNEITAIPQLLDQLELQAAIVTIPFLLTFLQSMT